MTAQRRRRIGRGARALVVVATLLAVTALTVDQEARACTCAPPPPPAQELERVDAVFAGQVVEITEVSGGRPETVLVVRMAVDDVWKGDVVEVVEVRTNAQGGTCGYGFRAGRAELVYASVGDDGRFVTSMCDRTAPLDDAHADLAALGEPDEPRPGERTGGGDGWSPVALVAGAAGLAAVAVAALAWLVRRRRLDNGDGAGAGAGA